MADKPHYLGHRRRLRTRFLKSGAEALADYELMELVLFLARARGDMKPVAKRLIDRFGSFANVISAESDELATVEGVGETTVVALKTVQAAALRLAQESVMDRPVMASWQQVLDYCRARMARKKTEEFRVLFLDNKNALIVDEVQNTGTVDHTPVYPREVVKRALELAASAVIMVHNHPSGDPTPSKSDIAMTREVAKAAEALGLRLFDHIIIGRNAHASLKNMGLF